MIQYVLYIFYILLHFITEFQLGIKRRGLLSHKYIGKYYKNLVNTRVQIQERYQYH